VADPGWRSQSTPTTRAMGFASSLADRSRTRIRSDPRRLDVHPAGDEILVQDWANGAAPMLGPRLCLKPWPNSEASLET
jgi:hypothetical protein